MNDQQKFLQDELESIQESIQVKGYVAKHHVAELKSLDEMAAECQESNSISFDWLVEFRMQVEATMGFVSF